MDDILYALALTWIILLIAMILGTIAFALVTWIFERHHR